MRKERPVVVVLLAVLHLGIGGLTLAALVVGIARGFTTNGIHVFALLGLMLAFALGPAIGLGLLFQRVWAWFTATVLYLLVAALGAGGLWVLGTSDLVSIEDVVPAEVAMLESASIAVLVLYILAVGVLFGLLFTTSILSYFGLTSRVRRWVLPAEVFALVAITLGIGFWTLREERAAAAATEASANLPIIRQIGERAGAASDIDVEFLLERLESINAEERLNAAWALGQCGRPEAIEPLTLVARDDDDSNVRINAIASLVKLGGAEIGAILVELIDDPDVQVQQAALRGLADKKFRSLAPQIGRLLDSDSADVRSMAVDVLGNMADPIAIPVLRAATADADSDIRSRAAFALGKLRDPSTVDALAAMLTDTSWEVRANAAQALGMVGAPDARDALSRAADDSNSYVRDAARQALGRLQ